IGSSLTRAVMQKFPVTASLSQSDPAWATFRKLQWSDRTFAKLYLHIAPRFLHRRANDRVVSMRFERSLAPDMAERIDGLWLAVRATHVAMPLRDADHLNRRYGHFRGRSYCLSVAFRGDEVAGCMITRILPRNTLRSLRWSIGLVVDYLVRDQD